MVENFPPKDRGDNEDGKSLARRGMYDMLILWAFLESLPIYSLNAMYVKDSGILGVMA